MIASRKYGDAGKFNLTASAKTETDGYIRFPKIVPGWLRRAPGMTPRPGSSARLVHPVSQGRSALPELPDARNITKVVRDAAFLV
jgi:hypothetical protein